MSVGNLFKDTVARITGRRWGTKALGPDGQERDTGVGDFAEELANAFNAGGATDVFEPVVLNWHGQGPLFVINDIGANGQAMQLVRRDETGDKVHAATVGVGLESDGLMANWLMGSRAFQPTLAEQNAYYARGMPYVYTEPGGPGATNVGDSEGVGYPPKYHQPVSFPFWDVTALGPCGDPSTVNGYTASTRMILTIDTNGACEFMTLCQLLQSLPGYDGGASMQVLGHQSGVCTWIGVTDCP